MRRDRFSRSPSPASVMMVVVSLVLLAVAAVLAMVAMLIVVSQIDHPLRLHRLLHHYPFPDPTYLVNF